LDAPSRRQRLASIASTLGVPLDARALERLGQYLDLLLRWNQAYNLTAVRDPDEMLDRHIADCLAIVPHLPPGTLADLGSGAGLPGLVVAIAEPERPVFLVESNGKKARFLREVKRALGLSAVTVVEARAEAKHPAQPVAVVTARALAELAELVRLAASWLGGDGVLVAMKSKSAEHELAALPPSWALQRVVDLAVPGLAAERNLVLLRRGNDPARRD
jgi:16S rRNA (guanine527-N7)-methyltransferase